MEPSLDVERGRQQLQHDLSRAVACKRRALQEALKLEKREQVGWWIGAGLFALPAKVAAWPMCVHAAPAGACC